MALFWMLGAGPAFAELNENNAPEPVSMNEREIIRAHMEEYWNVPVGGKDADTLIVNVRINTLPDGTVTDVQIVDRPLKMNSFWVAAADAARRAVRLASPLPIPRDKYEQFKAFTFTFDPKQMVGRR